MAQIHKQFTTEQITVLLEAYIQGHLSRGEIEKTLGINKTRFFAIMKQYRTNPETFSISYERKRYSKLNENVEEKIQKELFRDKELIDNKDLPVYGYNYSSLNDRLKKEGIRVSTTTIIKRAKLLGCYQVKKQRKSDHDREVITSATGDLIQHDASIHKWSPYTESKWTLITSLDDHSRMFLYAEFVESETSWAHIRAVQYLMQQFGVPYRYYVDNLRVFRFIQHRDSVWKKLVLGTDDVNTQWRQVLALMNTDVIYAMSPQAKGKIERPYRWLQERIVRTCALEHIETMADASLVLNEEVHRYNYLQVHSTTQEIPALRFERALKENRTLFRPFTLPKPFTSAKDIFCIRHHRVADGYRRITIAGNSIQIPGIRPREEVDLHFVPDESKDFVEIRFWATGKLVHTENLPLNSLKGAVHF